MVSKVADRHIEVEVVSWFESPEPTTVVDKHVRLPINHFRVFPASRFFCLSHRRGLVILVIAARTEMNCKRRGGTT